MESPPEDHKEQHKRVGITNHIRSKLKFQDERLWKRFSARRLELIDTLDLSSRKASEQEDEIKKVAELLRSEFNYGEEFISDFDKLVRAAIQSVRRNRKRSSRSRKAKPAVSQVSTTGDEVEEGETHKKPKTCMGYTENYEGNTVSPNSELVNKTSSMSLENDKEDYARKNRFVSEILRLNSDSQDDGEKNYSSLRQFSVEDKSRAIIKQMVEPRMVNNSFATINSNINNNTNNSKLTHISAKNDNPIGTGTNYYSNRNNNQFSSYHSSLPHSINQNTQPVSLPPPQIPQVSNIQVRNETHNARLQILNLIERSRACTESRAQNSENLPILGRGVITCCISYVFEKSFAKVSSASIEYLRTKLTSDISLARIFRDLDPQAVANIQLNDEAVVLSFCTLLGGCVKDFGFDSVMSPLGEIFYWFVLQDYPLIAKNSLKFDARSSEINTTNSSLDSLATVATMQAEPKKKVILRFLTSKLEFTYPEANSATPRLIELIENGKSAFKLESADSSVSISLRDVKSGQTINSDNELEKTFKSNKLIELEMFVRRAKEIPIHQLPSTVFPAINADAKILLPPPVRSGPISPIANSISNPLGFKFLSNQEDTPTPPPSTLLPNFQPLL